MLSSAATSITVVLIFSIYWRRGGFNKKPIDKGFLLAVHDSNPVKIWSHPR
jgi:phosphate transport system permease protein